jgi:uncharacterized membrane protein
MFYHPYDWGIGVFAWLFPVLMLALLFALIVALMSPRRRDRLGDADPLRRAAARYAAGDIEWVEFDRIRRDLTSTAAPTASNPLTEAALRLARGDITTAGFDEIRSRITGEDGNS